MNIRLVLVVATLLVAYLVHKDKISLKTSAVITLLLIAYHMYYGHDQRSINLEDNDEQNN